MTPIAHVQSLVCEAYSVTREQMFERFGTRTIQEAREVAMLLCRLHLDPPPSYPELGRAFGKRDHTTVIKTVRRLLMRQGRDAALCGRIAALALQLGTAPTGRSDISLMPLARIDLDPAWEAERAARFAGGAG